MHINKADYRPATRQEQDEIVAVIRAGVTKFGPDDHTTGDEVLRGCVVEEFYHQTTRANGEGIGSWDGPHYSAASATNLGFGGSGRGDSTLFVPIDWSVPRLAPSTAPSLRLRARG